ncbi:MAG: TRAP transporter small permease [Synergistaceae bacterium]|jgi:TRAP-type C4-dicarboxylate transport system permease small subunit|nr:TRAP transporter small permease [Synergistaceae bacterium]
MLKLKNFFYHFEEVLGALFLAIMVTVAFVNVITRYVLKVSMAFTEELTLYLFVWITLLGVSLAFREGANMAVSALYNRFGSGIRRGLDIFAALCSVLFFAVFTYFGVLEVREEIAMGVMTEAMEFPVWFFTVSMPLAGIFTIVRILVRTRDDLRASRW